jgi:hypothetical protein
VRGIQIVRIHGQKGVGVRDHLRIVLGLLVNRNQLLVHPGDGSGPGKLGGVFFEQRLFARRLRLLLDALKQDSVFALRVDVHFVPVGQDCAGQQQRQARH